MWRGSFSPSVFLLFPPMRFSLSLSPSFTPSCGFHPHAPPLKAWHHKEHQTVVTAGAGLCVGTGVLVQQKERRGLRFSSRFLFDVCVCVCLCVSKGTCRPCLVDIVPVKNEEGLVIMFILDFQKLTDPSHKKSSLKQRVIQGWIYCKALKPCLHETH